MSRPVALVVTVALFALGGCAMQNALRDNTLKTTATLSDLHYSQVLNNVAMFSANPAAVPSLAVLNAGTVTVSDTKHASLSAVYSPTLTTALQGGGALPILSLLPGGAYERHSTENWSVTPVTDTDCLRRLRCAFQLLILGHDAEGCDQCYQRLEHYYLGEGQTLDCLIPRGWYHVGLKHDVPKNACHVGRYCDTYVWVTPEGLAGLGRFTLTVLDLSTGSYQPPQKTVVHTYDGEGKLQQVQVTTTAVDQGTIDQARTGNANFRDRARLGDADQSNRGLFFVE